MTTTWRCARSASSTGRRASRRQVGGGKNRDSESDHVELTDETEKRQRHRRPGASDGMFPFLPSLSSNIFHSAQLHRSSSSLLRRLVTPVVLVVLDVHPAPFALLSVLNISSLLTFADSTATNTTSAIDCKFNWARRPRTSPRQRVIRLYTHQHRALPLAGLG